MREFFLNIVDPIFAWLLVLGPTAAVIILGMVSATAMVLLRKITTDQKHLGQCDADRRQLKVLRRKARRARDKEAAKRYKNNNLLVQLKQLRAEGMPLLAGMIPIALIGTWSFYRLEYHPPAAGEPIGVELSLPANAVDSLVTLVPADGIEADSWIQRARKGSGEPAHAIVRWQVSAARADQSIPLTMRYRDQSYTHPLAVGGRTYELPVVQHHPQLMLPQSVVRMEPVKVLGFVPWYGPTTAIGAFLPGWLITYIIVVVPFVVLLKRVLKIY
ncbi:MAG: hypothetical protein ACLFUJ_14735 [Phycisphaerae bacterium]